MDDDRPPAARGWRLGAVAVSLIFNIACSDLLPKKNEEPELPWTSFTDIKQVYDLILPNTSTIDYLHELGINPYKTPNISIVSYLDIRERFIPNSSIRHEDVDPGVLACIAHRTDCYGYVMSVSSTRSKRVGNAFLDILSFRKTTIKEGWKFEALFVIDKHDGQEMVVYKIWRGAPHFKTTEKDRNPLGPLNNGNASDLLGF